MRLHRLCCIGWVCALLVVSPAAAQSADTMTVEALSLDGPRVGFTYLSGRVVDSIDDTELRDALGDFPFISQFGWQWERRFFTTPEGATGVTEWVLLLGGVEQNIVLPSLTWLVGFRTAEGTEFGFGPNLSVAGTAWVFAGGLTFSQGSVNFPVNVALAASSTGTRLSLLVGFNVSSQR